jgi:excisionase family DNA binding protein
MSTLDVRTKSADDRRSSLWDRPPPADAATCESCPLADGADVADVGITALTAAPTAVSRRDGQPGGKPAMEKLLLTPEEAAEALNISRSMLYDLIRLRSIKSVKIGKARRIPAEAMRQYVDALMSEAI